MAFLLPRAAQRVRSLKPTAANLWRALAPRHLRKSSIILMVAAGFSSITQCPEFGTTAVCTLVAADRKDRHGQHALGDKRLVVGGVLIKRLELFESGVHGARRSVKLGVVFA